VNQVFAALTEENGALLEECLSMNPQAIRGGGRLLKSRLSDVSITKHVVTLIEKKTRVYHVLFPNRLTYVNRSKSTAFHAIFAEFPRKTSVGEG